MCKLSEVITGCTFRKLDKAIKNTNVKHIAIAGGVSANSELSNFPIMVQKRD